MDAFDVVIAGGGPAGSTCAWKLRRSGLRVAIVDRLAFPRNKVCGGWITPAVVEELDLDAAEYARGRVFQPIHGFLVGAIGERPVEARYAAPVSYGIRRIEFDHYLLQRSGAKVYRGSGSIERNGAGWVVDGTVRAPVLVGAGGTFCPVARMLGAKISAESLVAAQEAEVPASEDCAVVADTPELYFCRDLKGYGWLFRKQGVLNFGLGRLDAHALSAHMADFLRFVKSAGRIADALRLQGHAYLVYGVTPRRLADDGVLLIGDAAGLAYPMSGEGIRPAVESALIAAGAIESGHIDSYPALVAARFGRKSAASTLAGLLPAGVAAAIGRRLLSSEWFARNVVLDRWFLRSTEPAVTASRQDSHTT